MKQLFAAIVMVTTGDPKWTKMPTLSPGAMVALLVSLQE